MRFSAVLELGGKTATGIVVPPEVVEALSSGQRPAVRVTLREHTYRSTVAVMGGRFLLPVSADVRAAAGVAAGDTVDVDLELDTEPRTVPVPDDLAAALDADPAARRSFDGLPHGQRRWFVLGVEGAKTPQTRERRIGAAVERLREGRGQR